MKRLIVLLVIGLFAVGVFAGPLSYRNTEDMTINSGPGMWKNPNHEEELT